MNTDIYMALLQKTPILIMPGLPSPATHPFNRPTRGMMLNSVDHQYLIMMRTPSLHL